MSPKLQLTWHFNDDTLMYASSSLSYRSGAYSVFNFNPAINSADTERNWANEIGVKSRLMGGKLELSLAGFWYNIQDYQIERFDLTGVGGFGVTTVPEVVSRGVEFEVLAKPFEGLELSAGVGYTDAEFQEYRQPFTGQDLAGRKAPYVPEFTANFSAQYQHACGFMGRVDWLLTGRTFFDETNSEPLAQNAFGILNAKLGYERKNWGVYVYGRNLTDSEYYSFKLHPFGVGTIGEPRTIGMMATLKF